MRPYTLALILLAILAAPSRSHAQGPPPVPPLPAVPVPAENPISESKRVLGKILFWDEQLSSDGTMACGTCHLPTFGGTDDRIGINPGLDGQSNTADDVLGSPGVVRSDETNQAVNDAVFGFAVQVTGRTAPSAISSQFAPVQFWDGRASGTFLDPQTGATVITTGGSLESQAVVPILSEVEMGHVGRSWNDVVAKLDASAPLALASDLPSDMNAALSGNPSYGDLFAAAFGDPAITASRIGMAIATYERTLVADQTPFDAFLAGNRNALTQNQINGFGAFGAGGCAVCHGGPNLSDNSFRNIGLRPNAEDNGRGDITGATQDAGRFKVPSLRNVGLKNRFFHNGQRSSLQQVMDFYLQANGEVQFNENKDPAMNNLAIPPQAVGAVIDFLQNALTDPRVAAGIFPFDRPTLASERVVAVDPTPDPLLTMSLGDARPNPFNPSTVLPYRLVRDGQLRLSIFDVRGQRVRVLFEGFRAAGDYAEPWDGTDDSGRRIASGVYLYVLEADGQRLSGRVALVK